jgi:hypothetical protein
MSYTTVIKYHNVNGEEHHLMIYNILLFTSM